jgi:hypothetical protein
LVSGFGVFMVLLGSFLVVVGFQLISDCQRQFSYVNCWDPFRQLVNFRTGFFEGTQAFYIGTLAFYIGSIQLALGVVILSAGPMARMLEKLRGA